MTLQVAVSATLLLLVVAACPTIHEAPTLKRRIGAVLRCMLRPFTRENADDRDA